MGMALGTNGSGTDYPAEILLRYCAEILPRSERAEILPSARRQATTLREFPAGRCSSPPPLPRGGHAMDNDDPAE